MNRLLQWGGVLALAALLTPGAWAGSLYGDTVTVTVEDHGTTDTFSVGAGIELDPSTNFGTSYFLVSGEYVDFGQTTVDLNFLYLIQFTMTVTGIDTPLTNVTSSSSAISSVMLLSDSSFKFTYIADGASTGHLDLTFADTSTVPEPSSAALLLSGLAALGWVARRKRGSV